MRPRTAELPFGKGLGTTIRAGQPGSLAARSSPVQTSSLIGTHPSLPGPERQRTGIPAGQRPFWWAWEDLNLELQPETKIARTNGSATPRAELGRTCCPVAAPPAG